MGFKELFFHSSLFYLIIYIPLSFCIYSNTWYEFNYDRQETYQNLDEKYILENTQNLISFFSHKTPLNDDWSEIENIHLREVRTIYDILFILEIFFFLS